MVSEMRSPAIVPMARPSTAMTRYSSEIIISTCRDDSPTARITDTSTLRP